jgi:hypothetical protein
MQALDTDYLIIGSGAVGMAFADVLFHETQNSIVLVDRHAAPGGHWNDAYPFVRLHQPSAYYGVNSRALGDNAVDAGGLNQGMHARATSAELMGYYGQLMQQMVDSGRVRYFPMSDYVGDYMGEVGAQHPFKSLLSGQTQHVLVRKKVVDTTHLQTQVPSTHPPKYALAPEVNCVPVNLLAQTRKPPSGYVVVGAGKTGIDACLWLLENGMPAGQICWIMPRDSWFQNRINFQPGEDFVAQSYGAFAEQVEIIAHAQSVGDVFTQLEARGQLLRLDTTVQPTMYHGAIVSQPELALLRQIENIVRLGRVLRIDKDQIVLERGVVASDADRLYVDCSASAVQWRRPAVPIFAGNKITPQMVRTFQPTFSAALLAHVETRFDSDAEKNALCRVIPFQDQPVDYLAMLGANMDNQYQWSKNETISRWILQSRLDGFTALARNVKPTDLEKLALLKRYGQSVGPAAARLKQLLTTAN